MADDDGELLWFAPDPRCILELDSFRVSRSLRTLTARGTFVARIDAAFEEVVAGCADRARGTWISAEVREAYVELHRLGFAHSVEAWREGRLSGGLYGVTLGGAFFGESMFHRETNASKFALVALVERLRARGFVLLDIQFMTEHLRQFGALEIPRRDYLRRLHRAIRLPCTFVGPPTSNAAPDADGGTEPADHASP